MENKWLKVIVHASAFYLPFIIPILFLLLVQDERVKSLSIQALLFQVMMAVLMGIAGILSAILIGIPFLIAFSIMLIVVPIIGIIKAITDQEWNYPIVGRFV